MDPLLPMPSSDAVGIDRPGWIDRPTVAVAALIGSSLVLVWVLLEWLSQPFLAAPGVSGWYPPAGLGVAMVWVFGWRYLPAVLLSAWLGQVLLWTGHEPLTPGSIGAGTCIAVGKVGVFTVVGLTLYYRMPAFARYIRPGGAAWSLLLMLAGALATGAWGVGMKALWGETYGGSFGDAAMGWSVGDAIGMLVAAPLIVWVLLPGFCRSTARLRGRGAGKRAGLPASTGPVVRPLGWGLLTGAGVAGLYIWPATRSLDVMYLGFVALPMIAMVYGLSGGLLSLLLVNVLGLAAVSWYDPSFTVMFETQLILLAVAVPTIIIGVVSTLRMNIEQAATSERQWTELALRGGGLGRWQWEVGTTHLVSDYMLTDRLGYPREQVQHDTRWWRDRVHPEDESARQVSVQRCLSGEADYHDAENRMLDAEGRWVWYHTQGQVIRRDDAGRATVMAGTHQEITTRKRLAELEQEAAASHRSEQRFRAMADASPVGVFQTDARGAFLYVNPAWTQTTGLAMSDALYRHAPAFAHPDDRDEVADHWAAATRLDAPLRCEMRIVRPDEVTRWVSMQASPIAPGQGPVEGFVGTVVDITGYREQYAMIADSEARYRTLAEHANDMLWRVRGEDAVFTYVSPSVKALLGYEPEEMVGTDAYDYFHPEDVAQVRGKHQGMTPEQPEFINTHRYRRKDGEYIVLDAIGRLVTPEDPDEPAYIVGISRDVTLRVQAEHEREELEQRLLQSQKLDALGGFARGVAHDFRNTLYAINASAQSAARHLEPDHAARRPLQVVQDACKQASEITQSLLTFARGQGATKERLDLAELVEESARLLDALLPPGIAVHCPPRAGRAVWTVGNRGELEQVLMNLATNARDAMPDGGALEINLDTQADQAVLTVTDSGQGMTPEVLQRAIDPFYTTKTRLKGTGLGLALVHGVIENHGGTVTLDSTPGRGTTVTVHLPLAENPNPAQATTPTPPLPEATAS